MVAREKRRDDAHARSIDSCDSPLRDRHTRPDHPLDGRRDHGDRSVSADGASCDGHIHVDACDLAVGTILELGGVFVGFQSAQFARVGVRHIFACANGTGSFILQLTIRLDFQTETTEFRWSVLSGTGDYAKLHGTGTSIPGGLLDHYTGTMHID